MENFESSGNSMGEQNGVMVNGSSQQNGDMDLSMITIVKRNGSLVPFRRDRIINAVEGACLLYTSPSPRDKRQSRMPSSA